MKENRLPLSPPVGSASAYTVSTTPVPTPPAAPASAPVSTPSKKLLDISSYTKRAWKLVHDPELHPKGSIGRSKPKAIRQSGQDVSSGARNICELSIRLRRSLIREDSN